MPAIPIDLNPTGTNSLSGIRVSAGRQVQLMTSGAAVAITFTSSPFTDGSTQFTVSDSTGVTKTTSSSAGTHSFTAGDRTGDIDITVSV